MKFKWLILPAILLACVSIGFAQTKKMEIKVFLVALGDDGKKGTKIGCDDSLVPVMRTIKKTTATLKASIEELLSIPRDFDGGLSNYWGGQDLKVKSVSLKSGTATIYLTGTNPAVAGVCDPPRFFETIEATAKQFSSVKKVKVFINGKALDKIITAV
ncbi:hypothetical protein BH10ACI1_BH10ACI1_15890 [soil metagenome]